MINKFSSLSLKLKYQFSRSRVEVFCLRDNPFGFEGQVLKVKPGFYTQVLFQKGWAIANAPGFRERLLPNHDSNVLSDKISFKAKENQVMSKIKTLYLEFLKPSVFANPNLVKQPISDEEIIQELQERFSFKISKQDLNLSKKIDTYGQTTLNIQNYFCEDLGKLINFQLRIMIKSPKIQDDPLKTKTNKPIVSQKKEITQTSGQQKSTEKEEKP